MGCAAIAKKSVVPALLALPDQFEVVAIASRSPEKAQEFAFLFGCKAITGYDNLLLEDIDAVYVPLPTGLHDEWVNKALLLGKHVYAEKSIAISFASAQSMVENAKKSSVALMEGYMFLYHTQHQKVKSLVAEGAIGEIRNFRGAFGVPPLAVENFRYDDKIGGGALFDVAGYPLRAVRFMLGDHFKVTASNLYTDPKTGTNLYGSAFLKDENEIGAQIVFGLDHFYQCNYEIWGTKGKIKVERAYTPAPDFKPTIILEQQGKLEIITEMACNHFIGAMQAFYDSITGVKSKEEHYTAILLQSESLQQIKDLSKA